MPKQDLKITLPSSGYLRIKVVPKSGQLRIAEIMEENIDGEKVLTYKIRLKAVPKRGKANEELIKFLSKDLDLPKNKIEIISGKTERIKLIKITK